MVNLVLNPDTQHCIDDCLHCYRTCLEMAMNHCLETGGRHMAPEHFRLMINCADICRVAADFMLSSSPLHANTCAACAVVCEACATSCEDIGNMEACVQACRRCSQSCQQMAGDLGLAHMKGGKGMPTGLQERLPM